MDIEYSIVIPVYNSISTLEPLYKGIESVMKGLSKSFEVIFVDDASKESTWQELLRIKETHSNISLIRLSKNFGQNGATLCGIDSSVGKRVITIDDDLQTNPESIKSLIEVMDKNKADVVYGAFPKAKNNRFRNFASKMVKRIFDKSQGGGALGSSFRLIEGHIADRIKFHSQDHLFINQVIPWYTVNIEHVEIPHDKRREGESGYSLLKLFSLSLKLIFYYTSIPLVIMIFLCGLGAISIVAMISYYLYYQSISGRPVDYFVLAVLVSMVIISGSIAVFGVYINRIYSSRVKKPNYSIKVKI